MQNPRNLSIFQSLFLRPRQQKSNNSKIDNLPIKMQNDGFTDQSRLEEKPLILGDEQDNGIIDALIILFIKPQAHHNIIQSMELQLVRATYLPCPSPLARPLLIICNPLTAQVDLSPKKCPKYKKVGKVSKQQLLDLVEEGSSIISAAKKLGINYSTAKSIIQNRGKEALRKTGSDSTDESVSKPTIILQLHQ